MQKVISVCLSNYKIEELFDREDLTAKKDGINSRTLRSYENPTELFPGDDDGPSSYSALEPTYYPNLSESDDLGSEKKAKGAVDTYDEESSSAESSGDVGTSSESEEPAVQQNPKNKRVAVLIPTSTPLTPVSPMSPRSALEMVLGKFEKFQETKKKGPKSTFKKTLIADLFNNRSTITSDQTIHCVVFLGLKLKNIGKFSKHELQSVFPRADKSTIKRLCVLQDTIFKNAKIEGGRLNLSQLYAESKNEDHRRVYFKAALLLGQVSMPLEISDEGIRFALDQYKSQILTLDGKLNYEQLLKLISALKGSSFSNINLSSITVPDAEPSSDTRLKLTTHVLEIYSKSDQECQIILPKGLIPPVVEDFVSGKDVDLGKEIPPISSIESFKILCAILANLPNDDAKDLAKRIKFRFSFTEIKKLEDFYITFQSTLDASKVDDDSKKSLRQAFKDRLGILIDQAMSSFKLVTKSVDYISDIPVKPGTMLHTIEEVKRGICKSTHEMKNRDYCNGHQVTQPTPEYKPHNYQSWSFNDDVDSFEGYIHWLLIQNHSWGIALRTTQVSSYVEETIVHQSSEGGYGRHATEYSEQRGTGKYHPGHIPVESYVLYNRTSDKRHGDKKYNPDTPTLDSHFKALLSTLV